MRIYALTLSADNTTIEPTLLRTLKPHATPVVVLAVDRTGTLLATGAADGNIKVWDIRGGFVTHTFRGPSVLVSALLFFEIAAGRLGEEQQQPAKKSKKKSKRKSDNDDGDDQDDNDTAATSVRRFRLASGSQDGKVRVWDLHRRAVVADLSSHVSDVRGMAFSAAQHALVTASRDKTLIWWDAKSWTPRKVLPVFEAIEAAGFVDEEGRVTYTAGAKGGVRLWETDTGREVTTSADQLQEAAETEAVVGATLCAEKELLLAVQADHTLALYQMPSMRENLTIPELPPLEPIRRISGTHDEIIDLAYVSPDRSMMALATNLEDVRLISVQDNSSSSSSSYLGQDIGLLKGHTDIVITLDVDGSGHWLATGAKDNTARLWRIDRASDSYTCWATFTGHAETLGAVALPKTSSASADQPPPFLVTGSQDLTVKKWEIPRQAQTKSKALFTRKAHDKDINALDIHPTAQLFASASQDKTVKIWSVAEGEVQGILRGHKRGVWSVQFAPASTPTILGDNKAAIAGKGLILTGSGDKTVKIWSLSDYACIRTFEGHTNSILKVVWLATAQHKEDEQVNNNKRVQFASAGGDGLVKVWDATTGETATTLDNHEDRVWALAVHAGTLVSGSADGTVTFWKDTSAETQAAAVQAATQLIEQEQALENYMHAGAYRDAIALALQLNHPGRLLKLFTAVTTTDPEADSLSGRKAVDEVLASLSDEQLFLLLLRLRDWNTNARTAPVAQRVLGALVRSYPANKFSSLSAVKGQRGQKSLKEVVDALRVYTERHYKRMEELVDESYLVEYTLQEMENLAPSLEQDLGGDVVMVDAAS